MKDTGSLSINSRNLKISQVRIIACIDDEKFEVWFDIAQAVGVSGLRRDVLYTALNRGI